MVKFGGEVELIKEGSYLKVIYKNYFFVMVMFYDILIIGY